MADSSFQPADALYHRCTNEDIAGGIMLPPRIRVENPSVNWSKYSKPWDVIFDHPHQGIVRFIVRNLPKELPKEPLPAKATRPEPHSFVPEHIPEALNYSHAEIKAERGGARINRINSVPVRKEFQNAMSKAAVLLRKPRK